MVDDNDQSRLRGSMGRRGPNDAAGGTGPNGPNGPPAGANDPVAPGPTSSPGRAPASPMPPAPSVTPIGAYPPVPPTGATPDAATNAYPPAPAGSGDQGGAPAAAEGPSAARRPRWIVPVAVGGVLAVLLAAIAAVVVLRDRDDTVEVRLVAATDAGDDPFTGDASLLDDTERGRARQAGDDAAAVGSGTSTREASAAGLDPAAVSASVPSGAEAAGAVYGSRLIPVCDVDKIASALERDPDARRAWASLMGTASSVEAVRSTLQGLTTLVLTRDTVVRNSRYASGKASWFPAVLEAGTPVLVDRQGLPRVKCSCGNPLDAVTLPSSVSLTGTRWSGFDEDALVAVAPVRSGTTEVATIDLSTGWPATATLGGGGGNAPVDPNPAVTTTTTAPPATAPTTTAPPVTAPPVTAPPTTAAPVGSRMVAGGYGPLRIGMSRSEVEATGWATERADDCNDALGGGPGGSGQKFAEPGTDVSGMVEFGEGDLVSLIHLDGHLVLGGGVTLVPGDGSSTVRSKIASAGGWVTSESYNELMQAPQVAFGMPGGIEFEMFLHSDGWDLATPYIYVCD